MILNNFLYRVRQFAYENRARLIKWLLILAAVLVLGSILYTAIERYQRWTYEKKVQALEKQFLDAEAKAKQLGNQAAALMIEIDAKQSELQFIQARAEVAETNLKNARRATVPLKEAYDETRITFVPMPSAPVSCADACRELAAIGYPCK